MERTEQQIAVETARQTAKARAKAMAMAMAGRPPVMQKYAVESVEVLKSRNIE